MRRRGEANASGMVNQKSWIKLENFYGIEIKDFAVEVARLSLLIAEFQCDVRMLGQKEATALVLPLKNTGQIHCGNALRMDWLKVCPPIKPRKPMPTDLFGGIPEQTEIDFDAHEAETYICGNPPYIWTNDQSEDQKIDLKRIFSQATKSWKALNYVSGWFFLAAQYNTIASSQCAFVSINTICQGQHVPALWPIIFKLKNEISFAYTSFKWSNLASNNAGVTVVIIGLSKNNSGKSKWLFQITAEDKIEMREVNNINAYLCSSANIIVKKSSCAISNIGNMIRGNMPYENGHFLFSRTELNELIKESPDAKTFIKKIMGSDELIKGKERYCLWIENKNISEAKLIPQIYKRISLVKEMRENNTDPSVKILANRPHQFREMNKGINHTIVVPAISSESREYLTAGLLDKHTVITNRNYGLYDFPFWNFSLLSSRIHLVWASTICGRLELRLSYTNTLGWNTFPVPTLTDKNKADLTRCAEEILLAREAHFPATIADLYDPEKMPENLQQAHERNDEVLERIYIGRRFKNDTERLEKLFDLYTKMTAKAS